MKNIILLLSLLSYGFSLEPTLKHQYYNRLTLSGDIYSVGLPLAAIAYSFGSEDEIKIVNNIIGTGLMLYSTDFVKRHFETTSLNTRPNGFNHSFPSGHAACAFYGARMIHRSLGWDYALPAYSLAVITSYSRIDGHYHHLRDVVAGAALAIIVEQLTFSTIEGLRVQFIPGVKQHAIGFEYNF